MTPRKFINQKDHNGSNANVEQVVQRRISAYEYNITTTHWPHLANYHIKKSGSDKISGSESVSTSTSRVPDGRVRCIEDASEVCQELVGVRKP